MNLAVVTEVSTVARNADVLAALDGRGLDVLNVGMKSASDPELTYIHTGLLSGLLLNTGRVDFVVGGCGTGQGYEISVSQYPGVFCGRLADVLDAWLFTRINSGNCASLPLNQGYGWAGDVNLRLMFDQLFMPGRAAGYPEHRRSSQERSRSLLKDISALTHRTFAELLVDLPAEVVQPVLAFPGVLELLDPATLADRRLADAIFRVAPTS